MRGISIVALVSTIGCSVVAAVDPARDAGAALLPFGATCQPCVARSCAAIETACAADPACVPLARCVAALAPNDVAGRGDCEARFASALTLDSYQRLDTCLRQECLDPCLGRQGLLGAYPPACRDCYEQPQNCGDQIAACVRDGACERSYRYCFGAMSPIDPSRVAECFFTPASALGVADELASCLGSCPQDTTGLTAASPLRAACARQSGYSASAARPPAPG